MHVITPVKSRDLSAASKLFFSFVSEAGVPSDKSVNRVMRIAHCRDGVGPRRNIDRASHLT
jgi:hypothetical protein